MPKKIIPLTSYVPASVAASILSKKLGRQIRPDYIRKLKNVRTHTVNATSKLYCEEDIQNVTIRKRVNNHDEK
jgi:hypothetical protein